MHTRTTAAIAASTAALILTATACGGGGRSRPAAGRPSPDTHAGTAEATRATAADSAAPHRATVDSDSMADTVKRGQSVGWRPPRPGEQPADGELVVLTLPTSWTGGVTGAVVVRRVLGVGGDRVRCCGTDGRLVRDDRPLAEPYLKAGEVPSSIPFDVTVPAGRVWVMGDHRSDAADSRYHQEDSSGTLPVAAVVGYVTDVR